MKPALKMTHYFLISFVCFICFLSTASIVSKHKIARFDNSVIGFIQNKESPPLTLIMKGFTFIGSSTVVVVLAIFTMIFLFRVLHHRLELLLFFFVIAGSALLNYALKLIFRRERPSLHRLIQETGYSFPSGHSMEAFALYGTIAFLLWKHIPTKAGRVWTIMICIFMIVMIGLSRIYLGVHYPSDVIGAYFASGCWFAISVWGFQWIKEHVGVSSN